MRNTRAIYINYKLSLCVSVGNLDFIIVVAVVLRVFRDCIVTENKT